MSGEAIENGNQAHDDLRSVEPNVLEADGDKDLGPTTTQNPDNISQIIDAISANDEDKIKHLIAEKIDDIANTYNISHYDILFLFDDNNSIIKWHADMIYRGLVKNIGRKPILLIISSVGGRIEPAYLISKTLKKLSNGKFVVAIPRQAKSAATLISLGADEIHMGNMSELGPIDPQIRGYPALGLSNALDTLAELTCRFPGAADMLSKFLTQNLDLGVLGYFNRVSESAIQYGERLLIGKTLPNGQTARSVADHLVNHYKDHGFVIDIEEARNLLGEQIIKEQTNEYNASNEIFEYMGMVSFLMDFLMKKEVRIVGSAALGVFIKPSQGNE